jgi:hypothetical protein
MVASTMAYSMSGWSETASKSRLKTSALTQSRYRLRTVFQGPNCGGRSRHGLPVRAIHKTFDKPPVILAAAARVGLLPPANAAPFSPLGVGQHISVHPKLESQYLAWGSPNLNRPPAGTLAKSTLWS